MKMTSLNNVENDNIVLFPSAKNFLQEEEFSDPMIDLLNEFSQTSDSDIPYHLDERFEDSLEDETVYGSLEAFMARNQNHEGLTADDKLVKLINDRMRDIAELKERINFYLNEIEMFSPRKR